MAKRRPSGDGMVRKRDDGRWEGRIVVGHKENGDSIFRYIYADTQKGLTAKLRQSIDIYQGIDLTEQSRMTLAEWLEQWLGQMSVTLRPSTLENYQKDMTNHVIPYLGQKSLSQITAADLRKIYDTLGKAGRMHPRPGQSRGLSSTTVHGIHTTLHHALRAAVEQGLIPINPADEVEPPKVVRQPMNILNEEQLGTFMETIQADPFWHDLFYTELTTGLRRGEICGLMWSDFDARDGTLKINRTLHREKGGRLVAGDTKTYAGMRKIVLPPSTAELLRTRKKKSFSPWIFHDPLHPEAPISPDSAYQQLKKFLADKLGISPRTVERTVQMMNGLTEDAREVFRHFPKYKLTQSNAMKLSRMEPSKQKTAAILLASGQIQSVDEYQPIQIYTASGRKKSLRKETVQFLESVADLKDPTKSCKQTPETFIGEYESLIQYFQQGMESFRLPNYEEVLPALSQEQLCTLKHLTDSCRKTLEGYLSFVKETRANG